MSVPKARRASGAKRSRLPAGERREQILAVAAGVFAEKGYRRAQVTDIVRGAGIGRGTFYLYFDSKREAFLQLIERYFADFAFLLEENHRRLNAAVRDGSDVLQVWRENMREVFEYHRRNSHLTTVVYREAIGRDEDFRSRVDELVGMARDQFIEQFTLLRDSRLIGRCKPEVAADIVMGSSIYLIMEHVLEGSDRELDQLIEDMLAYHVSALAPRALEVGETRKAHRKQRR